MPHLFKLLLQLLETGTFIVEKRQFINLLLIACFDVAIIITSNLYLSKKFIFKIS